MTENKFSKSINRMSPKTRRLFNTAFILIVIMLFIGINILSMFLVKKYPNLEKDWTSSNTYTLRDATKEYLTYMKKDVNIKVLLEEDAVESVDADFGYQVNKLLREVSTYSKVDVENLDLIATSVMTMQNQYPDIDWTVSGNYLVVEDKETGRYKGVGIYDVFYGGYDSNNEVVIYGQQFEQALLSAIQYVTSDDIVTIAMSTGNGEVFNEKSDYYDSYSYLPYLLQTNAYEVIGINLLTETPSEETDVILMTAPTTDLTSDQVDKLTDWLENDGNYGKTFIYVPNDLVEETPNLDIFLEDWNMKLTKGYVYENDLSRIYATGGFPSPYHVLVDYYDDTYTENLKDATLSLIMPFIMPVEVLDEDAVKPLLVSTTMADTAPLTAQSSEDHIKSDGTAQNAAAISTKSNNDGESSNVIYWGSSYALRDDYLPNSNMNNDTYFINLLNSITDNAERIVIEGATLDGESIVVTSKQQVTVGVMFILIIPVVITTIGIVVWVKRRHR